MQRVFGLLVRSHTLPMLGLAALTLVFFWNITSNFTTGIASDGLDGAMFAWNLWEFPHRLSEGQNPFSTNGLFHPIGADLAFHTYTPLLGLILWPVTALFGLPIAVNIAALAGAFTSGVAMYFLAHYLSKDKWASLLAGAAYVMLPNRAVRMSIHVNLNQLALVPLALLGALLLYDRRSRKMAIAAGMIVGIGAWVDFTILVWELMIFAFVALWKWRVTFTKTMVQLLSIAAATAVVVALPIVIVVVKALRANELDPMKDWGGAQITGADVFSWFLPGDWHPVWGQLFAQAATITGGERFAYVTITLLVLAGIGLCIGRSQHKWLVAAFTGLFAVFALGPFLRIAGHTGARFEYLDARFDIPLPYAILHFIPLVNGLRIPGRFHLVAAVGLAALAALAIARLRATWLPKWAGVALPVLLIGMLALESWPGPKFPSVTDKTIPAPYSVLAREPGSKAVLELPLQWRDGFGQRGDRVANMRDDTQFLYFATEHGKPLVGGMVARLSKERKTALESNPLYRQVMTLQGDDDAGQATFTTTDLAQAGIGYVVLHADRQVPAAAAYIEALKMPVLADDGMVRIYRVS